VAKAYDAANNIGTSQTISVTVNMTDISPPTVSITSPTNNSIVTDSTLIVANASDNVAVEKVEFYIDGNLINTRSTAPWQYNWNVRGLTPNTTHSILAKAYDGANNIGSSTTIYVIVNKTVQALQFNGTTDYVRLSSSASLTSFGNEITIESWIKLNSYGSSGGNIITSGNENEYAFAIMANGKLVVTMVNVNTQVNAAFIGKTTLALNNWYHVAFTYNGSVESILINGVVDTVFATSGNVSTFQYQEYITIGAYTENNTFHGSYFNGIMDELKIWNIARTQSQIQTSMNSELLGTESGLVGYWKMNGNVQDSSPYGNNGTIYGNPIFISFVH
jgi:hypothetical protein